MKEFNYYTQENEQYKLKIQKIAFGTFGILLILIGFWSVFLLFEKFSEKPVTLLAPLLLFAFGILIFLRTTAIILINPEKEFVSWQSFYFKKPRLFYFKDFDGFSILHQTNFGVKGTSTVGMIFTENNKERIINLRQTFMTTKSLQKVVEETERIMNVRQMRTNNNIV